MNNFCREALVEEAVPGLNFKQAIPPPYPSSTISHHSPPPFNLVLLEYNACMYLFPTMTTCTSLLPTRRRLLAKRRKNCHHIRSIGTQHQIIIAIIFRLQVVLSQTFVCENVVLSSMRCCCPSSSVYPSNGH